jgi:hypothetical protein
LKNNAFHSKVQIVYPAEFIQNGKLIPLFMYFDVVPPYVADIIGVRVIKTETTVQS